MLKSFLGAIGNSAVSPETDGLSVAFHLEVPEETISVPRAVPLGLLLSELVECSAKQSFRTKRQGTITLVLRSTGDRLSVEYTDDGIGLSLEDPECGCEASLRPQLMRALADQLGGSLTLNREGHPGRVVLDFPRE
jgi:two-component system, sensor histidine kinase PdtaS